MQGNYGHCPSCDTIMTRYDHSLRFKESGRKVDLCNKCADDLGIPIVSGDIPETPIVEEEMDPSEAEQFDDEVVNERFGQDA